MEWTNTDCEALPRGFRAGRGCGASNGASTSMPNCSRPSYELDTAGEAPPVECYGHVHGGFLWVLLVSAHVSCCPPFVKPPEGGLPIRVAVTLRYDDLEVDPHYSSDEYLRTWLCLEPAAQVTWHTFLGFLAQLSL